MIRGLIILLLIVGRVHTKATFYIGMTKEEFIDKIFNNSSIQKKYYIGASPEFGAYVISRKKLMD